MMGCGILRTASTFLFAILIVQYYIPCTCFTATKPNPSRNSNKKVCFRDCHLLLKSNGDDTEPDLFDYFDPLLSPHAYPNGISPNNDPVEGNGENIDSASSESYDPLQFSRSSSSTDNTVNPSSNKRSFADDDLFDPRISPHEYSTSAPPTNADYSVGFLDKVEAETNRLDFSQNLDVFDPTLSPHAYSGGTPSEIGHVTAISSSSESSSSTTTTTVGILLMDHGSRKQASNDALHELARSYQEKVSENVIVKAAHMEIAEPSIPEGLSALISAGVDEIVCHPYFLSPYGRHVSEDIPEIISGAIENLEIEIPITVTDPVGAHTDIMISAIQTVISSRVKT